MKKIFKIQSILLSFLILVSVCVHATALQVGYQYTGEKLIVSGSYANENDLVSIYVLRASDDASNSSVEPVIMEMTESDSEGNFSITIHLPETLPSGTYKLNVANGSEIWESDPFEHVNLSELNISIQNNFVNVTMSCQNKEEMIMLVGIYNQAGKLIRLDTDDDEDNSYEISVSVAEGKTYRVFFWNEKTMSPYCRVVSGNIVSET